MAARLQAAGCRRAHADRRAGRRMRRPAAQPGVAADEGPTGSLGRRWSVATPRLRRGSSRPVVRSVVWFEAAFAAERQGRWADEAMSDDYYCDSILSGRVPVTVVA